MYKSQTNEEKKNNIYLDEKMLNDLNKAILNAIID